MRLRNKILLSIFLALAALFGWGAYYAQDKGFTHEWREVIETQFADRGVYLELRRLNLDPFRGLIAKDVVVYEDEEETIPLLTISRITLDIDITKIFDANLALRAFDVRNANVTIPLDPRRKLRGDKLRLTNLSARILMPEDRVEVVRAEADMAGVHLELKGSLFRPLPEDDKQEDNPEPEETPDLAEEQKDRLRALRKRGQLISGVLSHLTALEKDPNDPPLFELEVYGDMGKPEEIQARGRLRSGPLAYGSFECEEVDCEFEFGADGLLARSLMIRDSNGTLRGRAELHQDRDELEFSINSSLKSRVLLEAITEAPWLKELAFYQPPLIEASGVLQLGKPMNFENLPMKVIGKLRSDRLTSKGVVFDALSLDFSVNGPNLYLRNLRLEHQSGLLTADILRRNQEVNFRAEMDLHPTAFKPFVTLDGTRHFLNQWTFHEESTVLIKLEGFGPSLNPPEWTTDGFIELQNCALNGYPIDQLQAELAFEKKQHHFNNVIITREGGVIGAKHVLLDHETRRGLFEGVEGKIFPVDAVGWFAPKNAQQLLIYKFKEPPYLAMHGEMDLRPPSARPGIPPQHDYHLQFATEGTATYRLFGKDLLLDQPRGSVHISAETVALTGFKAGVLGGNLDAAVEINQGDEDRSYRVELITEEVDFRRLAETYSDYDKTEGKLSGSLSLRGNKDGLDPEFSGGNATIVGGDVFSIPAFGPLSNSVKDTLPKMHDDFSVAKEATITFGLGNGKLYINEFDALTNTFRLEGSGDVDLETSEIDLEATINLRELEILKVVPKLIVFKGEGTVAEPTWRPHADVPEITKPLQEAADTVEGVIERAVDQLPIPFPGKGKKKGN